MTNLFKPAIRGVALCGLLTALPSFSSDIVNDDLITESRHTTPWTVCDTDSTGIDVSNLDAGGCAYRTTPAIPGTTYTMTCGVSAVKFASITLAFLDPTDTFTLATRSTEIHEDGKGAHSVTLQAPPNTGLAAIGIYGEAGSGFQDCVLIDSTPPAEPTKGSISGITWFDENGDSLYTTSEPAIHGTSVALNLNGAVIGQTTTEKDGSYYFGHLDIDACYTISFDSADPTLMLGAAGGDNDANADGVTSEICLTETAADIDRIDAPYVAVPPVLPPADYVVCGTSWKDRNGDGIFNNNDAPLAGVYAVLLDSHGKQVSSVRTDDYGNYVFGSLVGGDYQVQFTTPDGHEPTVASASPERGSSFIDANGLTNRFALPRSVDTGSACTIENVNAGYSELPVVLAPTIANDDYEENFVGEDFDVAFLDNDHACDGGVSDVNIHGHNVPGLVVYNSTSQTITVSNTTKPGNFSIEYGIRGLCGSYDTATIFVKLIEVIPPAPPAAPDAPLCRVETRGNTHNGGVDVFSATEFGFASSYNLFDIHRKLVTTVFSDDVTHKFLIGNDVDPRIFPSVLVGNYEIEWNGEAYGFDQTSIYYVSAIENGVESELSECIRTLISPIALDLDNQGRIERISGNYSVDVDGDGIKEAIGQWFGPTAGILVTANASGQIDGNHMFGNVPGVYEDGFAELATLDTNNDGKISGEELQALAIWVDSNSDTIVDDSELSTLASHDIASLALSHYKFFARATKSDGSTILMEDVWLPVAPLASIVE